MQDTGPVLAPHFNAKSEHDVTVILLVSQIPFKIHGYDEVCDFCDLGVLPCLQNLIVSWGANFACLALIKQNSTSSTSPLGTQSDIALALACTLIHPHSFVVFLLTDIVQLFLAY